MIENLIINKKLETSYVDGWMTLFMFSILIIVQYTLLFILLTQVVCVYLQLHITHYSIIRSSNLDILSSPRPQSFSTWNSMMPKYIYEYIYQYIRYIYGATLVSVMTRIIAVCAQWMEHPWRNKKTGHREKARPCGCYIHLRGKHSSVWKDALSRCLYPGLSQTAEVSTPQEIKCLQSAVKYGNKQ